MSGSASLQKKLKLQVGGACFDIVAFECVGAGKANAGEYKYPSNA
jgi:hypothetical protein